MIRQRLTCSLPHYAEAYEERYAGRANFEDVMRQEAVAHLVELASHGYFSEAELAPIAAGLRSSEAKQWRCRTRRNPPFGSPCAIKPLKVRPFLTGQNQRRRSLCDPRLSRFPARLRQVQHLKIGTGEGAQAYGHGLYFAGDENVARYLSRCFDAGRRVGFRVNGQPVADRLYGAAHTLVNDYKGDVDAALAAMTKRLDQARRSRTHIKLPTLEPIVKGLEELRGQKVETGPNGRLYEVNIKADPEHFLGGTSR